MDVQEQAGAGWMRTLLSAWRELARRQARERRLMARGLRKQAQRRLRGIFRDWVRSHERGKRREVEQRMQRLAEARSAAERRALVTRRFSPRTPSAAAAAAS
jgi:hypothetical protein